MTKYIFKRVVNTFSDAKAGVMPEFDRRPLKTIGRLSSIFGLAAISLSIPVVLYKYASPLLNPSTLTLEHMPSVVLAAGATATGCLAFQQLTKQLSFFKKAGKDNRRMLERTNLSIGNNDVVSTIIKTDWNKDVDEPRKKPNHYGKVIGPFSFYRGEIPSNIKSPTPTN